MTPSAGQRWTRKRPTAPGWYWWRAESFYVGNRCVEMVHDFFTHELRVTADDAFLKGMSFDDIPGEWQGPIFPVDTPNEATE